jgi:GNAT superfamily N-acetyltransferase
VITRRDDGYEIDTATDRLDVPRVHLWLSTDAYWAMGRSAEVLKKAIAGSLCFGLYDPAGEQVGFCRMITDDATFAWLCDVYVERSARGNGLGTWLARVAHDAMRARGVPRMVLATKDAHEIYATVGFVPLAQPQRWMEIDLRDRHGTGDVAHN